MRCILSFAAWWFLVASPAVVCSADFPNAEIDLAAFDAAVQKMTDEFSKIPGDVADKAWVKKKLKHMVDVDQYLREYLHTSAPQGQTRYSKPEVDYYNLEVLRRWQKIDRRNTDDLKALLEKYSWFTISEWGRGADGQAWLIVQHADHDRDFQKAVLAKLEKLYPAGETEPSNYAYLYDRVATSFSDPAKRQLQRYGTQGQCIGAGEWKPFPIEDPQDVDARRAAVGLPPLAEYVAGFKDLCK
jgi:hypothetical protein